MLGIVPHQSRQNIGSEMPIFHRDSFPPGEAKGRLRELVPFNVLLCSIRKWAASPQRIAKLATPTGAGGAKAAAPQREAKSLPYSRECPPLWVF